MKLAEFREQDKYCREHNVPEGRGCDDCPAKNKNYCADALRKLCGKWLDSLHLDKDRKEFKHCSDELEKIYGLSQWSQLSLVQGWIEFPE